MARVSRLRSRWVPQLCRGLLARSALVFRGGALAHLSLLTCLDPGLPALAWNASFLGATAQQAKLMLAEAAPFRGGSNDFSVRDRRRTELDSATAASMLPLRLPACSLCACLPLQVAVSETAMAWHSGQNGTTDSFLSGPWFISQARLAAATVRWPRASPCSPVVRPPSCRRSSATSPLPTTFRRGRRSSAATTSSSTRRPSRPTPTSGRRSSVRRKGGGADSAYLCCV